MSSHPHEHQFPEEETPHGVRVLYPCLLCNLTPAAAILAIGHSQSALTDLLAFGEAESAAALETRDRDQYQFWQGWKAALSRLEGSDRQSDRVCAHGTALDVHCCHCHRGFIFDKDHVCPPDSSGAC